ncbi:MAG: hypothetical protein R8P61_27895 [Bacteroidia bacterium]|nr:hypothetical protein [Bacteroidia bacterium]
MKSSILDFKFSIIDTLSFKTFAAFLFGVAFFYYNPHAELPDRNLMFTSIFVLVGILLFAISFGVRIDTEKRRIKHYMSLAFIRLGFWKDYHDNYDIVCLRSKQKHQAWSEGRNRDITVSGALKHEVYLADPRHFNLILLRSFKSNIHAEEAADELAEKMGLEWVQYNPARQRPRVRLGGIMKT